MITVGDAIQKQLLSQQWRLKIADHVITQKYIHIEGDAFYEKDISPIVSDLFKEIEEKNRDFFNFYRCNILNRFPYFDLFFRIDEDLNIIVNEHIHIIGEFLIRDYECLWHVIETYQEKYPELFLNYDSTIEITLLNSKLTKLKYKHYIYDIDPTSASLSREIINKNIATAMHFDHKLARVTNFFGSIFLIRDEKGQIQNIKPIRSLRFE